MIAMKRLFALLLCLALLLAFVGCDKEEPPTDDGGAQTPPAEEGLAAQSNLFMANDQLNNRVVVYDAGRWERGKSLDDLEVWSVNTGHAAGLKYREDSVFGDVVIVAGSRSAIYSYPEGKTVWSTNNPGNNSHSIELLPSGHIIIANSTGATLRLFYTNNLIAGGDASKAQTFVDFPFDGAHGVLWDPTYNVLWALGNRELRAYFVQGEGNDLTLVQDTTRGCKFADDRLWGHDLSPDYTDTRYLYLTVDACVMRFDKNSNALIESFENADKLMRKSIKGFSNNPSGNFFVSGETGGAGTTWKNHSKASWCTDGVYFGYTDPEDGFTVVRMSSTKSFFYKIRAFCGAYQ